MERKKIINQGFALLFVIVLFIPFVGASEPKVIYPEKTDLDFEGVHLEGELRNPGEFYFQRRPEEKFDSLVKRRKNFQREMLRDVISSN